MIFEQLRDRCGSVNHIRTKRFSEAISKLKFAPQYCCFRSGPYCIGGDKVQAQIQTL